MEKQFSITYKHVGDKLIKKTYNVFKGVCPYCGDDGVKLLNEVVKTNKGESVQRFICPKCRHTGAGNKFGLSREPVKPISEEIIEGIGTCPSCGSVNRSFANGSDYWHIKNSDEVSVYKYLRCRECGYRARYIKFGVKE